MWQRLSALLLTLMILGFLFESCWGTYKINSIREAALEPEVRRYSVRPTYATFQKEPSAIRLIGSPGERPLTYAEEREIKRWDAIRHAAIFNCAFWAIPLSLLLSPFFWPSPTLETVDHSD